MNKIPCVSQNMEVKTLPTDVYIFGHFGRLSSATVHSADGRFDSGVKWWIRVSSMIPFMQKLHFVVLKQLQKML